MARGRTVNNTVVGLFLIASVLLAVGASVMLSDVSFARQTAYIVRFSLEDGAAGLKDGSPVTLAGQPVGKVRRISFATDQASGAPAAVDVAIRIRSDLTIFTDASARLELPLLGSLGQVNIADVGTPAAGRLTEGGVIGGGIAPPSFLTQAGFGPEQRDTLVGMLDDASAAVARLRETIERVDPQIDPTIASAQDAIDTLRGAIARVNERIPGWNDKVDASLGNVELFTAELDELGERTIGAVDRVREVADEVHVAVTDNRPRLDAAMQNIESATARVNDQTIPKANELLATAQERVDETGEITDRVALFLAAELPQARRIVASGRLAADQLRLATTEIRAQPWRLLVRPDTKQLEEQLVYDAARTYAAAVGDLRSASEALDSVLARDGQLDADQIRRLRDELDASYQRYDRAEQELLTRLIGEAGGQ